MFLPAQAPQKNSPSQTRSATEVARKAGKPPARSALRERAALNRPAISLLEPLAKPEPRFPPQRMQPRDVDHLARRPVRLRSVEAQSARVAGDRLHHLRELADRDLFA